MKSFSQQKELARRLVRRSLGEGGGASRRRGYTIPEVHISCLFVALIGVAFWSMFRETFVLSRRLQATLTIQQELQTLMRRFSAEVRAAAPSETGAFAIASASSTQLTFYTDSDNDGTVERIRYYISGNQLRKGTLNPTGSPLAYTGSESTRTLVRNIVATTTPVFSYYNSTYAGTTTALTQPVTVSAVRSIKMFLFVDDDTTQAPPAVQSTTQVTVRTLKDNL